MWSGAWPRNRRDGRSCLHIIPTRRDGTRRDDGSARRREEGICITADGKARVFAGTLATFRVAGRVQHCQHPPPSSPCRPCVLRLHLPPSIYLPTYLFNPPTRELSPLVLTYLRVNCKVHVESKVAYDSHVAARLANDTPPFAAAPPDARLCLKHQPPAQGLCDMQPRDRCGRRSAGSWPGPGPWRGQYRRYVCR